MAEIPSGDWDLTVEAIYKYYEDHQEDGMRQHLGASSIGRTCERELWYTFRWVGKKLWEGRMLRLVETGKVAEERFVRNLREIGIDVREFDEAGRQLTVGFFGGHFGGSLDAEAIGIPEAPKTWHVGEFKTHNTKSFADLKENGLKASKPVHYDQMTIYMGGRGHSRGFYLAVNKDTEELYFERIEFDKERFDFLFQKAERIIFSENAPRKLSDNPTYWDFKKKEGCKYCDFNGVCHQQETPKVNCRTCCFATAQRNGTWTCSKYNVVLDLAQQKLGCMSHLYMPSLMGSKPVHKGDTFVQYADGRRNLEGGAII